VIKLAGKNDHMQSLPVAKHLLSGDFSSTLYAYDFFK